MLVNDLFSFFPEYVDMFLVTEIYLLPLNTNQEVHIYLYGVYCFYNDNNPKNIQHYEFFFLDKKKENY